VPTYILHPETRKLVLKSEYYAQQDDPAAPSVMTLREPFVSPVDGSYIDDFGKLRQHNKKHGVTDRRDYGEEYFAKKRDDLENRRQNLDKTSKNERIEALKHALDRARR